MSNRSLPSQLLNMLAPDIRSSLGELQGTLQLVAHDLAAKQDHDSVSQRRMELVKNASNRVSEFTNMLSIVTKLDALSQGDLKQQPERVDLLRLFDQLAHRINGQCTDAQVQLDVRFDPPDHDRLQGLHVDAANLTQLVGNILRFSWATTQQKMVSIEISLTADDLRLVIADNGLSMSDRELKQLFSLEPWSNDAAHRLSFDDPTLRLGLSLSRAMVWAMKGVCDVTSDSTRGVVWNLVLPYQLVVQTMLERQGYVVDVANDGIEACAAVKGNAPEDTPYCLILMDVQMPGMDGIEATRWTRNNGHSLPIVALTAKAFMEDEKACLEAGMNDFMTKPVNYEALLARVDMWLGDKSTQPSTLPGEKVSEMRVLMGEEAFKDALGVLSQEVSERHVTLHKILAEGDYAKASAELHTLFGIYAGYGFEELQHLARALQDSCDAKLTPPAKSLQHFDELSSELLHKIKRYRAETMA